MPQDNVHSRSSSNSLIFLVPLSDIIAPLAQLADWKMYVDVHLHCYSRIIQSHDKPLMKANLKVRLY